MSAAGCEKQTKNFLKSHFYKIFSEFTDHFNFIFSLKIGTPMSFGLHIF